MRKTLREFLEENNLNIDEVLVLDINSEEVDTNKYDVLDQYVFFSMEVFSKDERKYIINIDIDKNSLGIKVELLKYPTEQDWLWCKTCTLNTVGKKLKSKQVNSDWKVQLLEAEHSPIRELWFGVRMEIPYWVSVHFVRHHIGVNHYVQTQRTDRTGINRNELKQGELVSHIMSVNAQELVFMAHKRLCKQASPETRQVMQMIINEVVKVCPEMKSVLVPLCKYRNGKCTEMFSCKEIEDE